MDKSCKQAFLIIFALPVIIFFIFAWIVFGDMTFEKGIFSGINYMFIPTIILIALGGIIDHVFFNNKLLDCFKKQIGEKSENH